MVTRFLSWCLLIVLSINLVRVGVAESRGEEYQQIYFETVLTEFSNLQDNWYGVVYDLSDVLNEIIETIPFMQQGKSFLESILDIFIPYDLIASIFILIVDVLLFIMSALDFVLVLLGLPPLLDKAYPSIRSSL